MFSFYPSVLCDFSILKLIDFYRVEHCWPVELSAHLSTKEIQSGVHLRSSRSAGRLATRRHICGPLTWIYHLYQNFIRRIWFLPCLEADFFQPLFTLPTKRLAELFSVAASSGGLCTSDHDLGRAWYPETEVGIHRLPSHRHLGLGV